MLRFIIRRRCKDAHTGLDSEQFETIDINVPALEHVLMAGGHGAEGFDIRELVGVEILPNCLST